MASGIVGFGKIKEKKKERMMKKLNNVAFLQALTCKFICKLIK